MADVLPFPRSRIAAWGIATTTEERASIVVVDGGLRVTVSGTFTPAEALDLAERLRAFAEQESGR